MQAKRASPLVLLKASTARRRFLASLIITRNAILNAQHREPGDSSAKEVASCTGTGTGAVTQQPYNHSLTPVSPSHHHITYMYIHPRTCFTLPPFSQCRTCYTQKFSELRQRRKSYVGFCPKGSCLKQFGACQLPCTFIVIEASQELRDEMSIPR